jgi:hypothetical protein
MVSNVNADGASTSSNTGNNDGSGGSLICIQNY